MESSSAITQKLFTPHVFIEAWRCFFNLALAEFDPRRLKNKLPKKIATVTQIVEIILAGSIVLNGSDIHIEAQENNAKLRIRLDGVLQDVIVFDKKIYTALVNRIKLLSEMKLNITSKPQDGRFSILAGNDSVEIRASILPTEYGDSVVMRILNPKSLISLDQAGLRKDLYDTFIQQINRPNGMIIVTGPTGSGKTNYTLRFLKKFKAPKSKLLPLKIPLNTVSKEFRRLKLNPIKDMILFQGCALLFAKIPMLFW